MKDKLTIAAWTLAGIAVVVAALYAYLGLYKDYAPRMENARRGVFEQTQSYVHGKAQHITRLCLEYDTADAGHKGVLRTAILHEASTVEREDLPMNVTRCLDKLEQ